MFASTFTVNSRPLHCETAAWLHDKGLAWKRPPYFSKIAARNRRAPGRDAGPARRLDATDQIPLSAAWYSFHQSTLTDLPVIVWNEASLQAWPFGRSAPFIR
jgi:hypothetical protein